MDKIIAKKLILLTILLLFTASCSASFSQMSLDEKKALLREAASRYWEARLSGRYEDSYRMEDRENLPPLSEYIIKAGAINKFQIKKHEIKEIQIEDQSGLLDIEYMCVFPGIGKLMKQMLKDKWAWKDGAWRHIL